jgi:two-component system, cell cycle sensor histidine kinase and response regulator CckA
VTGALILVVDDNATTRKLLRIALLAEGYVVAEAEDGATALRLAVESPPRLVLLDFRLPDLDGPEVARQLHASLPDIPIIGLTGWVHVEDGRSFPDGFSDLLLKPVEPSRVVELVERHLESALPRAANAGKRVLVVDDHVTQRKLAYLALSAAGFAVVTAADGASALRLAREHKPDVVVSDVLMPGMDGFQVCRAVRADPLLADIPVVLTSAHFVEEADHELAACFGATRYVSRSSGYGEVVRATMAALDAPTSRFVVPPPAELQAEHFRRVAHQLERQAAIGLGLAQRASVQATALSVLESISNALAAQLDPESALGDTLTSCLDSAGLSVGAILLRDASGELTVRANVGVPAAVWAAQTEIVDTSIRLGSLTIPSREAGAAGDALLEASRVRAALAVAIVARDEAMGVLVLASNRADFAESGTALLKAARSVSMQIAQALILSRTFQRLGASERRYRLLFESARDGMSIVTPAGVILEANRGWEDIVGRRRAEIVGRSITDFLPAEPRTTTLEELASAVINGSAVVLKQMLHADGHLVQVELSRTAVEIGSERYVLEIARDVSERLRLAEQLRHAQKMDAVGRLAGGVAHDMNNVLAVVLSYSAFLLEGLESGEVRADDVREIRTAAQRGAALTKQLLAFSRQRVLKLGLLDLNETITEMLRMVRTLIGADVTVETRLAEDLPKVKLDPGHLEQVIMNLAINARDAMPTGGTLLLSTQLSDGEVVLSVADNGSGMTAATRERIFEPFFTTKPEGKGTGLGLATVFGIITQSEGRIEVESEMGRGTTFRIHLPPGDERQEGRLRKNSSRPPPAGGRETVLLVEDDYALRAALVRKLRSGGYQVVAAESGVNALVEMEGHPGQFGLLVTDVVLPGMSGADLARAMRMRMPDLRVLFMSGYTDTSAHGGVPVGGPGFLQKPFTLEAFASAVRGVLDE